MARLLIDVAISQLLRRLMVRLHQPEVLAYVLAGIALGPSLLGRLPGDPSQLLFPEEVRTALAPLGTLGLVIFAFVIGLELDLGEIRRRARSVLGISTGALLLPLLTGAGLALVLYARHGEVDGEQIPRLAFVLFFVTAMAVTAFPVLVSIVSERGIRRSPLGEVAVSSAALQDACGWVLLALALAAMPAAGGADLPTLAGATILLAISLVFLVRPLLGTLLARIRLLCRTLMPVTMAFFLPIYFLAPGLQLDIGSIGLEGVLETAAIIAVASFSKLVGGAFPARWAGASWRDAATLGVLLNTRGLMELVVLTLGYTEGVFDRRLFSEMVVMAIVTTMMTGPLLETLRRRGVASAGRPAVAGERGWDWEDLPVDDAAVGLAR
ncbi:MAG TPA: cation:proton antiporter [Solirubrobacterales bacterium]|nr:cation:proton antiporter [Solirubrobacterales bacterium]